MFLLDPRPHSISVFLTWYPDDLYCVENLFRDETKKLKKRKKVAKATLSFALDDEDQGEDSPASKGDGTRPSSPMKTLQMSPLPNEESSEKIPTWTPPSCQTENERKLNEGNANGFGWSG
jgi:hypothetical protein